MAWGLGAVLAGLLVFAVPAAAGSASCGTRADSTPTLSHVVWIVFENKDYGSIIGSPSAPYINSLAQACGLATSFFAEAHPSLPNYIAMTSGGTQGITDDAGPSSHPLNVPSIFSQLGSNWRALEQSMPSNCFKSTSGLYAVRHNPAAYYMNIDCAAGDVPLVSPPELSSAFTFVTPDLCNDMHDCPVQTGDTWLSTFMPTVLESPEYQAGGTVVFITWDEGSGDSQQIPTLVISPYTVAGTRAAGYYDHYSLLRTTEELLGLGTLGNASVAPSMRSAFGLKGFYPRPKGATPMRVPLVPAYQRCFVHHVTHGPPLNRPSCSPAAQHSTQLTLGTPDANGKQANSIGSVALWAIAGNPSTPADEADVRISTSVTDVRRKSDLADYTGELQTILYVRLTDRVSTTSGDEPQSVLPFTFTVTVPCTGTTDATIGSRCSLTTTADSVVPGAVPETKRSLWEVRRILVYDGGPDGLASSQGDNAPFLSEGIFVP